MILPLECLKGYHGILLVVGGLPSSSMEASVSGRRDSQEEVRYISWTARNAVMLKAIPRYCTFLTAPFLLLAQGRP